MKTQHSAALTAHPYESLEERLERGRQLQSKAVFDGLGRLFGKTSVPVAAEHSFPRASHKLKHS